MINFTKTVSKTAGTNFAPVIEKSQINTKIQKASDNIESVNLNNIPYYRIISPISTAREYLSKFFSEYKDIKSATFICEKIKQAQKMNMPDNIIEELQNKRQMYHKNIVKMRKKMWGRNFDNFKEYIKELSTYIKENGTYMNCNEAADLLSFLLAKSGIKTKKVFMYTVNTKGEPISKTEHVFCVLGLDKKANISDITSWGKSSAICDPWANIALNTKEGIEHYKKLFNIDSTKHILKFEDSPYHYPGWQNH